MALNYPFQRPFVPSIAQGQGYINMSSSAFSLHNQSPLEFGGGNGNFYLTYKEVQRQRMKLFWEDRLNEVNDLTDAYRICLPLARIKRIMKSDEEVKMISADAPVLLAKACEFFIQELTLKAWIRTQYRRKRTLQRGDVEDAITQLQVHDFLADILPIPAEDMVVGEPSKKRIRPDHVPSNGVSLRPSMQAKPVSLNLNGTSMSMQVGTSQISSHVMMQQQQPPKKNPIPNIYGSSPRELNPRVGSKLYPPFSSDGAPSLHKMGLLFNQEGAAGMMPPDMLNQNSFGS